MSRLATHAIPLEVATNSKWIFLKRLKPVRRKVGEAKLDTGDENAVSETPSFSYPRFEKELRRSLLREYSLEDIARKGDAVLVEIT